MYARCLGILHAELKVKARLQRNKINNNMHKRKNMNKEYIMYIMK